MAEIYFLIADAALRDAVIEQLKIAGLGVPQTLQAAQLAAVTAESAVVLCEGQDKKIVKTLKAFRSGGKMRLIFWLGDADGIPEDILAETFPKPLRLGHLLARLQFHLQNARYDAVTFGPFRLEARERQITRKEGDVIRLTEKEANLLEYLGHSKHAVSREELLAAIWGYDARIDTHTLETHIYRLRRKLDPEGKGPNLLIFEQGAYRLAG